MKRNWQRVVVAILAVLASAGIVAGAIDLGRDKYDIDSVHSNISFSVGFMGLSRVEGRFARFAGTVLYDETDITRSSATILIFADSVFTGGVSRDNHLKTADFFDVQKFPHITFQSQKTVKQGDGFVLIGPLSMHGVTREVAIAYKLVHARTTSDIWGNPRVGFDGRVTINRKDYGVGTSQGWERKTESGPPMVSDEVEIRLFISARIMNFDRVSGGPNAFDTPLWKTFEESGFTAMSTHYKELSAAPVEKPEDAQRREGAINRLGYKLLWRGKVKEAAEVLGWNLAAFPKSANVYDSLAEAQARGGDRASALANYKKSLELDPANPNALEMVRFLEKQ